MAWTDTLEDRLEFDYERESDEFLAESEVGDDFRWHAWPRDLQHCRRHGPTKETARARSLEAARSYLQTLEASERDRFLEPLAQLSIRIPREKKERIAAAARARGMTLTNFVLDRCLAADEAQPGFAVPSADAIATVVVEKMLEETSLGLVVAASVTETTKTKSAAEHHASAD